MKKIIILASVSALFIVSCKDTAYETGETSFYFNDPQPVNDSELTTLPAKFTGEYENGKDSKLIIGEKAIYREYIDRDTMTKAAFDSIKAEAEYKQGKLIFKEKSGIMEFDVLEDGDKRYLSRLDRDTIFAFSNDQKAKRINGHLVISTRDSIFWRTSVLSVRKDTLQWKYFFDKNGYLAIQPLVKDIKTNKDTSKVFINPTRREFGKILDINDFGMEERYKKTK